MNDSCPLPALAHDADQCRAAERWRGTLVAADAGAEGRDFAGDARAEDFLRVWPEDEVAAPQSPRFRMRALQGAVIANGSALIALALLMASPDEGSKAGLMASATVLGLGLMFAAISVVASLNGPSARMRLARIAAPVAGAVSYGALAAAFVLA